MLAATSRTMSTVSRITDLYLRVKVPVYGPITASVGTSYVTLTILVHRPGIEPIVTKGATSPVTSNVTLVLYGVTHVRYCSVTSP